MVWNRILLVLSIMTTVIFGTVCMVSAEETSTETVVETGTNENPTVITVNPDVCLEITKAVYGEYVAFDLDDGQLVTYRYLRDNPEFSIYLWSRSNTNHYVQLHNSVGMIGGTFSCSYWRTDYERPTPRKVNYEYFLSKNVYDDDTYLDEPVLMRFCNSTTFVVSCSPAPSVYEILTGASLSVLAFVLSGATTTLAWVIGEPLVLIGIAIAIIGVCFALSKKSSRGI